MSLCIATSQFPTCAEPQRNAAHMVEQVAEAARLGADLIHFPEACLSGYAGNDLAGYDGYDWGALRRAIDTVVIAVRQAAIWVVFGAAHRLSDGHKPHNSLYVIDPDGGLVDRYDKRFCSGDATGESGDLAHYTPGDHQCVFTVKDMRIGTLICHEYRYPELYRDYGKEGVQVLLQSFHSGNLDPARFAAMEAAVGDDLHRLNPATTIAGITQLSAMPAHAADNYMWISCANSSAPRSCWGAFMVRPDGVVTGRLNREAPGLLITRIDPAQQFYDSTRAWRDRAVAGQRHSGSPVRDPRSAARTFF
jgi:predicted amidohydrolase